MAAKRKTSPAEDFKPIKANHAPENTPKREAKTKPTKLPQEGFARIPTILAVFPVSKSGWWHGVRSGIYPKPVKLGPRMTAWRVEDIRQLIASAGTAANDEIGGAQ